MDTEQKHITSCPTCGADCTVTGETEPEYHNISNDLEKDLLKQDIKDLKRWKKEEIETFAPLLDYFHFEDKSIQLGQSIVKEAVRRSKAYNELVEALTDVVQHHVEFGGLHIDTQNKVVSALQSIEAAK